MPMQEGQRRSLRKPTANRTRVGGRRTGDGSVGSTAKLMIMRVLWLALTLLLLVLAVATPGSAQGEFTCDGTGLPEDGFASAGFGLTRGELDSLYGPGEAMQSGWAYQFDGYSLVQSGCNLIVTIDPASSYADPLAATDLVDSLLPQDSTLSGVWEFGTLQSPPQDAEVWASVSLDSRFELLNEPYYGLVMVLYTFDGDSYNVGKVARVEIRGALLLEE